MNRLSFSVIAVVGIACSYTTSIFALEQGTKHELSQMLIIKKKEDQILATSPFCGQLIIVSTPKDNPNMDIAVAIDIGITKAHFHKTFQEIYMVLDGELTLELYDPNTDKISRVTLKANELVMIPPGVHHRISEASEHNRLQVMCLPGFNAEDEHVSDKLPVTGGASDESKFVTASELVVDGGYTGGRL